MATTPPVRLGGLERRVMQHLWADASGERWFTVREVHEELARHREIAYTTVMTVLQRLARKRLVLEAREGRAYLYRATSSFGTVAAELMRDALEGASPVDRAESLREFVAAAPAADLIVLGEAVARRTARSSNEH